MEKFPKNQEAQSQNINHGSFSKNIWKQNLKVLLTKSYQKIRNQISIFQQWKIFRRSGIKISKYYSWKICKNARIPHVQQVSMVVFQKIQKTRSQNTPGSFSNMSGSNLWKSTHGFFSQISYPDVKFSKSYSWKFLKDVRTSHVQKVCMENFKIAGNKFSISCSWEIAHNIRKEIFESLYHNIIAAISRDICQKKGVQVLWTICFKLFQSNTSCGHLPKN